MGLAELSILVVDDVNAMRIRIKEILRALGLHNVKTASSGIEAKGLINEFNPKLIICDWHMRPLSGLDLLYYVRKDSECSSSVFIMVTAENTTEQVQLAVSSGVDDYLLKPITGDQIETRVLVHLTKKGII